MLPDDCRVCGLALTNFSRIPVCEPCLRSVQPFAAEYFCAACRAPFLNEHPLDEHGLCALCRQGLNGFDLAYSFGYYDGTLRKLIHLYKYQGIRTLAGPLGALLARSLPLDRQFDVVTPMPLHWRRMLSRGFNQSALLAAHLAKRIHAPVRGLLRKRKSTPKQAGLTGSERRKNVSGAFGLARGANVKDLRILLVDDVLTTGATASAAAAVLRRAGAKSITVLTVARVDRRVLLSDIKADSFGYRAAHGGGGSTPA